MIRAALLLLVLVGCARPVKPADPARRDPQTYPIPAPKNVIAYPGHPAWFPEASGRAGLPVRKP